MCVLGDRVHICVFGGRMRVCVKWVRVCVCACVQARLWCQSAPSLLLVNT